MADQKVAAVVWENSDTQFAAQLGSGYAFGMSSNPDAAGGSPMEFLLAGVAGCTAVDVVSILQKMRQQIEKVSVEIRGARAPEIPKVYTEVELVYIVQGKDVDPDAVERAIKLSKEKYCSASIMFQRAGVQMTSTYRIEETADSLKS